MNQTTGTIRILDPDLADAAAPGTHAPSLALITQYLRMELDCNVLLLGIQPESTALHARISPGVQNAIAAMQQFIQSALSGAGSGMTCESRRAE
jgi:Ni,Fe-hydrogenase maturation factor